MQLVLNWLIQLSITSVIKHFYKWFSCCFWKSLTALCNTLWLCNVLKGATIANRAVSKWEGLWFNSLDYLPVCYTQHSMLTVWYVGCYQSVTRNSNNTSGYLYNREFITQPIPISHSLGKFKFWIWKLDFFLKLLFLVVLSKKVLVSIICVTFNLDACKISFLYYL